MELHRLKTAISTGGLLSQQRAQLHSHLLTTPHCRRAQWDELLDDEDMCISPLDAPEFIPSGASEREYDCGTVRRDR